MADFYIYYILMFCQKLYDIETNDKSWDVEPVEAKDPM